MRFDVDRFTDVLIGVIKSATGKVHDWIAALEARVVELENRALSAVEYAGVNDPTNAYRQGMLVTRSGGLWIALHDTATTPPGPHWQHVVKKGNG